MQVTSQSFTENSAEAVDHDGDNKPSQPLPQPESLIVVEHGSLPPLRKPSRGEQHLSTPYLNPVTIPKTVDNVDLEPCQVQITDVRKLMACDLHLRAPNHRHFQTKGQFGFRGEGRGIAKLG